ncbi:hypothetical protein [Paraglaciecola sp. MB-3u-78]|uniref:hypothetical protein n=1 Tax=Paraglaciecola sp. MB-3u-78 TaxID=2058332 RepID=UPI000C341790|nr:hypothetical protein [Paraglaciecola sp. MB-3u-78]PKG97123.1 hypothetical protein CXF95_21210 [Paraglaciecola sp. MB-3u-78]
MISRILITYCVLIFAVVIPILEVNASHVFNSSWPAHARFHEIWQLITNCGIGLLCLWLAWLKNKIQLASVLVVLVMGGVLVAHAIKGFYSGSILSGNMSRTILGMELAAFAASVAVAMAIRAAILESRSKK